MYSRCDYDLIGNIVQVPVIKTLDSKDSSKEKVKVAYFTVAVNRKVGDKEVPDFIFCKAFRGHADILEKYCSEVVSVDGKDKYVSKQVSIKGHIETYKDVVEVKMPMDIPVKGLVEELEKLGLTITGTPTKETIFGTSRKQHEEFKTVFVVEKFGMLGSGSGKATKKQVVEGFSFGVTVDNTNNEAAATKKDSDKLAKKIGENLTKDLEGNYEGMFEGLGDENTGQAANF